MGRKLISSGGPWEDVVGYSRAVRTGDHVYVAGTTAAMPDGTVFGGDDAYLQAQRCFEIIGRALEEAGASFEDVVRTRVYITDPAHFDGMARAHGERFADIRPVNTTVVTSLMNPTWTVEIDVDAVLP